MELDRLGIGVRERGAWEAIDLGFVLARTWWRRLFWSWLLPSATCLLLLDLVTLFRWPWTCALIVWWLKPFWDRLPLHVGSRALFGETVGVRDAIRALPGLARADALPWLTWRRFSLTRSFSQPVSLLEGFSGEARARRLDVLHLGSGDGAFWLTIVCVHVESLLYIGVFSLLAWLIPTESELSVVDLLTSEAIAVGHLSSIVTLTAAALVAPFYTMGGFALYVSRRIELEAWDIEIRFRHRIQRRTRPVAKTARAAIVGLAFVLGACWAVGLGSSAARAEEAASSPDETSTEEPVDRRTESRRLAEEIVEGEAFHRRETVEGWRLVSSEEEEAQGLPEWMIDVVAFFEDLGAWFSAWRDTLMSVVRWLERLAFVGIGLLLVYLVHRYRDVLARIVDGGPGPTSASEARAPERLFGLDVRADRLPEDVPEEVRRLFDEGRPREALSLLYRAALSRLITRAGLPFAVHHTEEDCLALVAARSDSARTHWFRELTRCWQALAYAHRAPTAEEVERLCRGWQEQLHA